MSRPSQLSTGLLALPTEVIDHIIHQLSLDLLAPSPSSTSDAYSLTKDPQCISRDRRKRENLSNLRQTCKTLASITTPHLYRSVTLTRTLYYRLGPSSVFDNQTPDQRCKADPLVLFLRTLIEGGDALRGCVGSVTSCLILRQAHAYRLDFWPLHDPSLIAESWKTLAHTIQVPRDDEAVLRILEYCGLIQENEDGDGNDDGDDGDDEDSDNGKQNHKSNRLLISTDSTRCLPERILTAILLLCHSVRSITLACPPWDTQIPSIHARYRVLDRLISEAVYNKTYDGRSITPIPTIKLSSSVVSTPPPLSRLESVTFTNMHGLGRSAQHELYTHDGFCRGYLARGDTCPALARVPSVRELTSHGTLGGWEKWLALKADSNQDASDAVGQPSPPLPLGYDLVNVENRVRGSSDVAGGDQEGLTLKKLHIGSASLNPALKALLPSPNTTMTPRVRKDTIEQLILFQATIHDAPLRRSGDSGGTLDIALVDAVLGRHTRSLRVLDMMTCWDLDTSGDNQTAESHELGSGLPRPLRCLGLLDNLQVLRIALPLLATNRDLWQFYGMLPSDIIAASRRFSEYAPPDPRTTITSSHQHDPHRPSSALTRLEIPFLRTLTRSLKHLRISDYYFIPNSPYLQRRGEYGSGSGIPSFKSYKDADETAAARASGGTSPAGSSISSSDGGRGSISIGSTASDDREDNDDDYGADGIGGGDGWTYANTAPPPPPPPPRLAPASIAAAGNFTPSSWPSPPLSLSSHVSGESEDEEGPMREYTHKYLLPLALRRFAGVCSETNPNLESLVVDTMPMLRYQCMPAVTAGDGAGVPIEWLVRGGEEIRDMFGKVGVRFDGVFDVDGPGRMGFV